MARIVLGGGCFWCLEAVFTRLRGVQSVVSGYANGHVEQPSYEAVCGGHTGHAEVIELLFDESVLSLDEVLTVFFAMHDPTTRNRQGNDVGTQYRSGIYVVDDAQGEAVRHWMADLQPQPHWEGAAVVTEVEPLDRFWPAEAYHQRYFELHPGQGYCAYIIAPKVHKLLTHHADLLR